MQSLAKSISACTRCPRLIRHCRKIAQVKKREFRDDCYWGKPVPGFGDPNARLWIVGLAPAAHGANRTGRMFTGDSSGLWLYRALHQAGFASQAESVGVNDGLKVKNVFISSAARCAPPDNKPTLKEIANCERFLDQEYKALKNVTVFLALGKIAFDSCLNLFRRHGIAIPKPRPKFFHGAEYQLGNIRLLASFHPSRQNTNTKKLTLEMWNAIFLRADQLVNGPCSNRV